MFNSTIVKVGKKISIFFICCIIFLSCQHASDTNNQPKEKEGQKERRERDLRMMKDTALGYVPTDRLIKAKQYRDEMWQTQNNETMSVIS